MAKEKEKLIEVTAEEILKRLRKALKEIMEEIDEALPDEEETEEKDPSQMDVKEYEAWRKEGGGK